MKIPSTHAPIVPTQVAIADVHPQAISGPQHPLPHAYYPPPYMPYIPHPSAYPHAWTPGIDRFAALPPQSPGIATTAHNVSLAEFCAEYRISKSDKEKLERLEYCPGDRNVEWLDEKDWREFGSFIRLGWENFLAAHRRFCTAIKSRQG